MTHRLVPCGAALGVLLALIGCDSSDPSCRQACDEVEDWAQTVNFNEAPRLTLCGELCAHPVARNFERCCAMRDSVPHWFGCEQAATTSVWLTGDQHDLWEWVLTAITYEAQTDLVRVVGIMALSEGVGGCRPEPCVELTFEIPRETGEATGHDPVSMTSSTLEAFEVAKWDAIVDHPGAPEVPDLGTLTSGRAHFEGVFSLEDEWDNLFLALALLDHTQVTFRLRLPLCQAP